MDLGKYRHFIKLYFTQIRDLGPTVLTLGIVSFFADVAGEMLYPIMPIYLTSVLGASMTNLGLVEGVAEGLASLMKTFSGYYSDKLTRRKPFIVAGYLLGAIGKPLVGISQTWVHALIARGLDRFGKGIRSAPRDALLADASPANAHGTAFGWHRALDTLGASLGPIITLLFLSKVDISAQPSVLRTLYFWAFIPGIISVLILYLIKEPKTDQKSSSLEKKQTIHFFKLPLNRELKIFFLAWGIFSFSNFSDMFILMRVHLKTSSIQTMILMYVTYNLVYAFSSPLMGKWSDKIPKKNILILGLVIYSCVYCGFALSNNITQFWILFVVYGIYMAATEGISKAFVTEITQKEYRATALGILGTIVGFTTLAASVVAGIIWDSFGTQWAFLWGAFGSTIACTILMSSNYRKTTRSLS